MEAAVRPLLVQMRDLPPDLARLGDALEHAVSRAIARRRAQLRAARALGAVLAAVPLAFAVASVHVRGTDGLPATAQPALGLAGARATVHPGPERGDRIPAGLAAGNGPHAQGERHPLDLVPPPVGARSAPGYDPGVATERVDRRPPFLGRPI